LIPGIEQAWLLPSAGSIQVNLARHEFTDFFSTIQIVYRLRYFWNAILRHLFLNLPGGKSQSLPTHAFQIVVAQIVQFGFFGCGMPFVAIGLNIYGSPDFNGKS